METVTGNHFRALSKAIVDAIKDDRIDEADAMYKSLCELDRSCEELLVIPAIIAIQRGQALAALQYLNGLNDDRCSEIKALCLNLVGDPTWHGLAMSLLDSGDPYIRRAMRQMLCMPLED